MYLDPIKDSHGIKSSVTSSGAGVKILIGCSH